MKITELGKHSSSVCLHNNRIVVSYYQSQCEGWEQQVVIKYRTNKGFVRPNITGPLEPGDGNPVVFEFGGNLFLAISKFRKETVGITNVHVLWKHTDLHLYRLWHNEQLGKDTIMLREIGTYPHCAPRCAPLICGDEEESVCLLPCYDEGAGQGVILEVSEDGINRSSVMKAPYNIIQPTLIMDGNRIIGWARVHDMEQLGKEALAYCGVNSFDLDWRMVTEDNMRPPNNNESLIAFVHNGQPYLVFNDSPMRTNLVLVGEKGKRLKLHETMYASYPNYCLDGDLVHIVFTAYDERGFAGQDIHMVTVDLDTFTIIDRLTGI
jgi:hypothetical protein